MRFCKIDNLQIIKSPESYDFVHGTRIMNSLVCTIMYTCTHPRPIFQSGLTLISLFPPYNYHLAFTANFTNLGASGRMGPSSIGDHYRGQGHDGHVMLMSGIQHWRIPCTTRYTIEVVGASGGYDSLPARSFRGYGARMIGTFQLTKGETLKILVGQEGGTNTQSSSGGGGGSFVVRSDNTPLIIAGGGGGRETPQSLKTECHATASTSGNPGHSGCCTVGWSGGSNGNGANTADSGNSGKLENLNEV